jgi:hypothetical protein
MAAGKRGLFPCVSNVAKAGFAFWRLFCLCSACLRNSRACVGTRAPDSWLFRRNCQAPARPSISQIFAAAEKKRLIAVISTDAVKPADRDPHRYADSQAILQRPQSPTSLSFRWWIIKVLLARAEIRGAAIGAEIVHAPNPSKTVATGKPWEVRYIDALPTRSGFYFGPRVDMRLAELRNDRSRDRACRRLRRRHCR